MGLDGIEHFVSTPELQSEGSIGGDPLPPRQVFAIGPVTQGRPRDRRGAQSRRLGRVGP